MSVQAPDSGSRHPMHWGRAWAFVSLLGAVIACGHRELPTPAVPMATVAVDGSRVDVLDRNDEVLFFKEYEGKVNFAVLDDLDGDDEPELIVASEDSTGMVRAYSPTGEELWSRGVYPEGRHLRDVFPPPAATSERLRIGGLSVNDVLPSAGSEVLVAAMDPRYFASRLLVLASNGEVVSDYWNPGIMSSMLPIDIEDDRFVLVWGINNWVPCPLLMVDGDSLRARRSDPCASKHYSALALLDQRVREGQGQAPPYLGVGIPQGGDVWYGVVEPKGVKITQVIIGTSTIEMVLSNAMSLRLVTTTGRTVERLKGDDATEEAATRSAFALLGDCYEAVTGEGEVVLPCAVE